MIRGLFLKFSAVILFSACSATQLQESMPILITSGEGNYWQKVQLMETTAAPTTKVDVQITYQDWLGFGGTFNEAGWDALQAVSEKDRQRAIRLLFDANEGAAFHYGRIPIGSSDYAMDRYSLAPNENDFAMEFFSIERDKQLLIPFIKAALEVNPNINFWSSPWAPPVWMMEVNPNEKYPSDSGTIKNNPEVLQAHALYMAKFVEAYQKEGIVINAVQPQNEPGYAQHYPSCAWPDNTMRDYIANHLGPLFTKRLPDSEIWLGTMSNPNSDFIVSSVMSHPEASQYVSGVGLQWGMQENVSQYVSHYALPVMQTEHRCGNYPWVNTNQSVDELAPNDYAYAIESWGLIKDWITSGSNAYLAWNMVLDRSGANLDEERIWHQNALLVVNRQTNELILTPTYYVFRHLAQYIQPGAVRIKVSSDDGLAFKNSDGTIVTVLYNPESTAKTIVLDVAGKNLQFSIPARGWATTVL